MSLAVTVVQSDVTTIEADVLVLKHARSHYGADKAVVERLVTMSAATASELSPAIDEARLVDARQAVSARQVLLVGTPGLMAFRYREMRVFARKAIEALAQSGRPIRSLATTVHGAGYGLDILESLRSLVFGFQQGLTTHPLPSLEKIIFVERHPRRFEQLAAAIQDVELVHPPAAAAPQPGVALAKIEPPPKKRVFVAMPFMEEFDDVYQFGIYSVVHHCGYVCERVDESVFAGNIVDRIIEGIRGAEFVIADLTEARPNVYLEVGFAWGLGRPVILIARQGQPLHFDLSHHKCIFYPSIGKLAESLKKTVRDLFGMQGCPE